MHQYLDEHQVCAVEALFELKRICDKHNIRFYLLAGTALGAVRHEGMIPWDDDIDVGFLLEDLKKLQKVIQEELDDRFEYASIEVEPHFPRLFGKILFERRSCVDLFLIAKWTRKKLKGHIHWNITRFCVESYYRSINYSKPSTEKKSADETILASKTKMRKILRALLKKVRHVVYKCCFFLKTTDFIRIARWNEDYFGRNGYDCYANIYSIYGMHKETLKKEWIENISSVTFEGIEFITVGDTHAYLKHLYGDYMKLPPEEKRVRSRHEELFVKK